MRKLFCWFLLLPFLVLATWLSAEPPIQMPSLHAAVEIVRDANGIPHILAQNEHDLFFMQGWVQAQDRLFQMDPHEVASLSLKVLDCE